jgi:hypothetical protein
VLIVTASRLLSGSRRTAMTCSDRPANLRMLVVAQREAHLTPATNHRRGKPAPLTVRLSQRRRCCRRSRPLQPIDLDPPRIVRFVSRTVLTRSRRLGPLGGPQDVVVHVLVVGSHLLGTSPTSRCISVLTTSRIGSTTLRRWTRLLRNSKLRRWTSVSCGRSSNNASSSRSIPHRQ